MRKLSRVALGAGLLVLLAVSAHADTIPQYVVGQGWITINSTFATHTYRIGVVLGRSYCAETAVADFGLDAAISGLKVGDHNFNTIVPFRDSYASEPSADISPGSFGPSRVCWISHVAEGPVNYVVENDISADGVPRKFRVVDTTLWCPWFFSGSGFEAFVLIKNTTNIPLHLWVELRNPAGTYIGTPYQGFLIPADGSVNFQLSGPPFNQTNASGAILISHDGPPGALVANTTSLSFGQGVSFDTPFSSRVDFSH